MLGARPPVAPGLRGALAGLALLCACLACSGRLWPFLQDLCDGVDCSGYGSCQLLGPEEAICVCDAGFHAAGLTCEADEVGDECAGVDCSGHGRCELTSDPDVYPVCRCDPGYERVGGTNCVPGGGSGTVFLCGAVECDIGGGSVCCNDGTRAADGTLELACVPEPACGASAYRCIGADDCGPDEACCVTDEASGYRAACAAAGSCATGGGSLCRHQEECPEGWTCCASGWLPPEVGRCWEGGCF